MKKILSLALLAILATGAQAQETEQNPDNKPVFTIIKENPITSVKALRETVVKSEIGFCVARKVFKKTYPRGPTLEDLSLADLEDLEDLP